MCWIPVKLVQRPFISAKRTEDELGTSCITFEKYSMAAEWSVIKFCNIISFLSNMIFSNISQTSGS